jgi:hypothetical protein
MELDRFRASFMMFEVAKVRKGRCHMVDVGNLRFVLRHGLSEASRRVSPYGRDA